MDKIMRDNDKNILENSTKSNIEEMNLSAERSRANYCAMTLEDDEEALMEPNCYEQLELQCNLINAASQRVELYKKEGSYLFSASAVSERSSIPSTFLNEMSIHESIDGGFSEVEELISLEQSYESALKINRALSRRVTTTLTKLQDALKNNETKQKRLEEHEMTVISINSGRTMSDPNSTVPVRSSLFSIPYFKDRFGTTAPINEETEKKLSLGCFDLYTTKSRGWIKSEQEALRNAVLEEYMKAVVQKWTLRKKRAEKKLQNMDYDDSDEETAISDELDECKKHLGFFTCIPIDKLDVPIDFDADWSKIAAQEYDGHRTPEECHLYWINYMHPSISKDAWSEEEDISIRNCVETSVGKPKWAEITKQLNSGRTALQVMQRYVSFIKPALEPAQWSKEDSDKLLNLISTLRVGNYIPWAQISQHFLGYTVTQVQTRWRIIDPTRKKGNFTGDEDYLLVKALYMFGLNWNLILHYLPGRGRIPIKARFKRAILPGITYRPWRAKEDKQILENCSANSQHWRKMSGLLRKRLTCEIRLRFYILQFWQNLSGRKVMPPPLFPLSSTENHVEINEMRKRLNDFNVRFTGVTHESLIKGNCYKFRKTQAAQHDKEVQTGDEETNKKSATDEYKAIRPVSVKRKRATVGRVPSWPNRALLEFFLPSRYLELRGTAHDPMDHKSLEVSTYLGHFLQLNIKQPVSLHEFEQLQSINFNKNDCIYINNMVNAYDRKYPCGDAIGLIPPNSQTVATFRSLLLHKEKLKEMASNHFLFHRIPPSLFFKLGNKEKDLATILSKQEVDDLYSNQEKIIVFEDDLELPSKSRRSNRRAAAIKAKSVNTAFLKGQPSLAHLVENQDQAVGSLSKNLGRKINTNDLCKEEIMKKEDKLLFHRMLSMFFWPMLFTRESVTASLKKVAAHKVADMNCQAETSPVPSDDENVTITKSSSKQKFSGKLGHLDINEHETLLKIVESKRLSSFMLKKKHTLEESEEMNDFIVKSRRDINDETMASKKEIISMKRSLIIKKLWEDRRMGRKPQRKQKAKASKKIIVSSAARKSERIRKSKKL